MGSVNQCINGARFGLGLDCSGGDGDGDGDGDLVDYQNTIYVDPNGDATKTGLNPAQPTTYENAIANLAFSTNVVFAEGFYSDGNGPGTSITTITQSNVTFTSRQGGSGSNSAIITDFIEIGPGIERFRAFGMRFDGDILDTASQGQHYFGECSGTAGQYLRQNPSNGLRFSNCDFESMAYSTIGPGNGGPFGGASVYLEGRTVLSSMTLNVANHFQVLNGATLLAGISAVANAVLAHSEATIYSTGPLAISAPTSLLYSRSSFMGDVAGNYLPIDVAAATVSNSRFDRSASTIAGPAPGGVKAVFSAIDYEPANPADWAGDPAVPNEVFEALDLLAARQSECVPVARTFVTSVQEDSGAFCEVTGPLPLIIPAASPLVLPLTLTAASGGASLLPSNEIQFTADALHKAAANLGIIKLGGGANVVQILCQASYGPIGAPWVTVPGGEFEVSLGGAASDELPPISFEAPLFSPTFAGQPSPARFRWTAQVVGGGGGPIALYRGFVYGFQIQPVVETISISNCETPTPPPVCPLAVSATLSVNGSPVAWSLGDPPFNAPAGASVEFVLELDGDLPDPTLDASEPGVAVYSPSAGPTSATITWAWSQSPFPQQVNATFGTCEYNLGTVTDPGF